MQQNEGSIQHTHYTNVNFIILHAEHEFFFKMKHLTYTYTS